MSDGTETVEVKLPTYFLTKEMNDIEYKLSHLLAEGILFCNNGWWYEKEGINWPKDHITIHVNCNDIFAWGCADAENVTHDEINELYEFWKKDNDLGSAVWCIKKRKQMPQHPVEKMIKEKGIWNLEELIK